MIISLGCSLMVVAHLAFCARGYEISKLLTKNYSELPIILADRNKQGGWHFFLKIRKRADWNKRVYWIFLKILQSSKLGIFSNFLVLSCACNSSATHTGCIILKRIKVRGSDF